MQGSRRVGLLILALLPQRGGDSQEKFVALQARRPAATLPACAERFDVNHSAILRQFQIILVSVPASADFDLSNKVLGCFKDEWEALPVKESDSTLQIPTGEIMMKVKSGTERSALDRMLRTLGLKLVTEPRENRAFKVATEPLSATKAETALKSLRQVGFVEFAEPNWLTLRARRPPR
jgi:hypothetical protein